ncbi:MAG: SecE/sec61-gamma family protein translocase subunit [Promethearchaeota archaeon]
MVELKKVRSDFIRMMRLSKKPSRTEVWLSVRICVLGMVAIGLIAFIIKLIFTLVVGFTPPTA